MECAIIEVKCKYGKEFRRWTCSEPDVTSLNSLHRFVMSAYQLSHTSEINIFHARSRDDHSPTKLSTNEALLRALNDVLDLGRRTGRAIFRLVIYDTSGDINGCENVMAHPRKRASLTHMLKNMVIGGSGNGHNNSGTSVMKFQIKNIEAVRVANEPLGLKFRASADGKTGPIISHVDPNSLFGGLLNIGDELLYINDMEVFRNFAVCDVLFSLMAIEGPMTLKVKAPLKGDYDDISVAIAEESQSVDKIVEISTFDEPLIENNHTDVIENIENTSNSVAEYENVSKKSDPPVMNEEDSLEIETGEPAESIKVYSNGSDNDNSEGFGDGMVGVVRELKHRLSLTENMIGVIAPSNINFSGRTSDNGLSNKDDVEKLDDNITEDKFNDNNDVEGDDQFESKKIISMAPQPMPRNTKKEKELDDDTDGDNNEWEHERGANDEPKPAPRNKKKEKKGEDDADRENNETESKQMRDDNYEPVPAPRRNKRKKEKDKKSDDDTEVERKHSESKKEKRKDHENAPESTRKHSKAKKEKKHNDDEEEKGESKHSKKRDDGTKEAKRRKKKKHDDDQESSKEHRTRSSSSKKENKEEKVQDVQGEEHVKCESKYNKEENEPSNSITEGSESAIENLATKTLLSFEVKDRRRMKYKQDSNDGRLADDMRRSYCMGPNSAIDVDSTLNSPCANFLRDGSTPIKLGGGN